MKKIKLKSFSRTVFWKLAQMVQAEINSLAFYCFFAYFSKQNCKHGKLTFLEKGVNIKVIIWIDCIVTYNLRHIS